MNQNEKKYLMKFYDALYDNLERDRKLKEKSVFISFLRTNKTPRYKLLTKSAIPSSKVPNKIINFLLLEKLITSTNEIESYTITAKGVWSIENEKGKLDEDSFISYINKEYFTIEKQKKVTDNEKVVLFSMIVARTFSDKSPLYLETGSSSVDKWKEILDLSCDKLISLKVIPKTTKNKLYSKAGNEHAVSNLIRHNIYLSPKIKGIYHSMGSQNYYLDIYDDSQISKDKLSYLFWKIFNGNLNNESIDEIAKFCSRLSDNMSIYIFDLDIHIFSTPKYDIIVKDCLKDSMISKTKWENWG